MGIEALYRRPRTTKPEPGHKIYPYLLRDLAITRPNPVWTMDTIGQYLLALAGTPVRHGGRRPAPHGVFVPQKVLPARVKQLRPPPIQLN
jgi:hypothetical protein